MIGRGGECRKAEARLDGFEFASKLTEAAQQFLERPRQMNLIEQQQQIVAEQACMDGFHATADPVSLHQHAGADLIHGRRENERLVGRARPAVVLGHAPAQRKDSDGLVGGRAVILKLTGSERRRSATHTHHHGGLVRPERAREFAASLRAGSTTTRRSTTMAMRLGHHRCPIGR